MKWTRSVVAVFTVLVLVLSQGLAAAHFHDDGDEEPTTCSLCVYSAQSGQCITSGTLSLVPVLMFGFQVELLTASLEGESSRIHFSSRAPPVKIL